MLQPQVSRGSSRPYGASFARGGTNFAIFSKHATSATLVIFDADGANSKEILLNSPIHKTGDVWHVLLRGLPPGASYCWRFDRQPNDRPVIHRYNSDDLLLDPYALAIVGGEEWGVQSRSAIRRAIIPDTDFDWEYDQPLNIPLADSVIYEMHVRGFTRDPSSRTSAPGTFAGVIEKIPYLKSLGVTAVELLPVNEFEESDTDRNSPFLGHRLLNLWGYQPIGFFAPNSSYASSPMNGGAVREFKEMVRELHKAGIEVILDVVFNHTCEGDERGPVRSFRGIDNSTYYIIDPITGAYSNYSGCGNTVNCNNPVVRRMIADALSYWVTEMHVDGFRFDLASILGRGQDGSVLASPPLLEELAAEPVLGNTKLIAEAWDAAGLYQVGTFPHWGRWAEWNGKYRDDLRRFVRGDEGMARTAATRILGSPDLYGSSAREPYHSVNFITCHDGFTLLDLVSYNEKHNLANGENNADGANDNWSYNHGTEGPTPDPAINALRLRQQKNFLALLLMSHGVPMLLAGDEFGRTQGGNNNAYCQDNEVSWLNWDLAEKNAGLLRFVEELIAFRKSAPLLRRRSYNSGLEIRYHGVDRDRPDWSWHSRTLAIQMTEADESLFLVANAWQEPLDFELPEMHARRAWRRLIDTSLASPGDIVSGAKSAPAVSGARYRVDAYSVCVLIN